ncbi:MAG: hypothetical protein M1834_006879 [Cirrosporium novae-zelandiae]|nr:MAG: hypothetical protein M1834_006879 [Cirrosporium novae-zelandiae]
MNPEKLTTTVEVYDTTNTTVGGHLKDLPSGYYCSPRFIGSYIAIILLTNSLYIGFMLPANAFIIINEDIGPSPNYLFISTAFTLSSGVGLALVGRLGDILGRRYFLIGGQILGFVGSLICATANTINILIAGTVIIGIAAAVQLTFTFVVQELVPNRDRAYANAGLFASTVPLMSMGPAAARLLVSNTKLGWRWYYYLEAITCGISVILFGLFYFPPNFNQLTPNTSKRAELKKLDYVGLVLYSGGLTLVLLGLSWGGSAYPWASSSVLVPLVVGFIALVALIFYETCVTLPQPLIPMKLFRITNYNSITISACVGAMIYYSSAILWPQQIAVLYSTDNIEIGWLSCAPPAATVAGGVTAGVIFKRLGHAKWQLIACCLLYTSFVGGMAAATADTKPLALAFTILACFGVGYLEFITIVIAGLVCSPSDIGLACGLLGSLRQVSGCIATTIYMSILTNRLGTTIPSNIIPAALSAGLPGSEIPTLLKALTAAAGTPSPSSLTSVPGITSQIISAVDLAVKTAYAQAFRTVYLASIAFGGLALVAALFSKDIAHLMTDHVARKLRGKVHELGQERDEGDVSPKEKDTGQTTKAISTIKEEDEEEEQNIIVTSTREIKD